MEGNNCIHCGGLGFMSDSKFSGQVCFMCGGTGTEDLDNNDDDKTEGK